MRPKRSVPRAATPPASPTSRAWSPPPPRCAAPAGNRYPLQQVEFLAASSADGPWRVFATELGPVFESRLFQQSGTVYLRARAVDQFGNSAESDIAGAKKVGMAALQMRRHDHVAPASTADAGVCDLFDVLRWLR